MYRMSASLLVTVACLAGSAASFGAMSDSHRPWERPKGGKCRFRNTFKCQETSPRYRRGKRCGCMKRIRTH